MRVACNRHVGKKLSTLRYMGLLRDRYKVTKPAKIKSVLDHRKIVRILYQHQRIEGGSKVSLLTDALTFYSCTCPDLLSA